MRIRNTKATAVTWTMYLYYSSYSGWSERAGVSVNRANTWESGGNNCAYCTVSINLSIPPGRISNVVVTTASGSGSGTRPNFLAFYNDCLELPDGLEWVDDQHHNYDGPWSSE